MINLENVTTYGLLKKIKHSNKNIHLFNLMIEYSIDNFQKLKDLIDSRNPYFDIEFLKEELSIVENNISRLNSDNYEISLYLTNGYNNLDVDFDAIIKTESETLGNELIKNLLENFQLEIMQLRHLIYT